MSKKEKFMNVASGTIISSGNSTELRGSKNIGLMVFDADIEEDISDMLPQNGKKYDYIKFALPFHPYRKHGVKITHPDGTIQKIFNSWYE